MPYQSQHAFGFEPHLLHTHSFTLTTFAILPRKTRFIPRGNSVTSTLNISPQALHLLDCSAVSYFIFTIIRGQRSRAVFLDTFAFLRKIDDSHVGYYSWHWAAIGTFRISSHLSDQVTYIITFPHTCRFVSEPI